MAIDLILRATNTSGLVSPSRIDLVFRGLSNAPKGTPQGRMQGQELRLAFALELDDPACVAFSLDFVGQGREVRVAAHGPSAVLLAWAVHVIADSVKCTLFDVDDVAEIDPTPDALRGAASLYLADYEEGVEVTRARGHRDEDGAAFVEWLVCEEHVALAEGAGAFGARLPMDDAPALYEMLLESPEVEDVFISERELAGLLGRYKARTQGTR